MIQLAAEKLASDENFLSALRQKARHFLLGFTHADYSTDALGQALRDDTAFLRVLLERAPALPPAHQPYSRFVIYSGPEGEAMVARWAHGARCLPHDHGAAHGLVSLVRGAFTEQAYRLEKGALVRGASRDCRAGEFLPVAPGDIHCMSAHEEGITLHLYAPAIAAMKVYDEDHGSILTVADHCGAWVPDEPADILGREPLHRRSLHD